MTKEPRAILAGLPGTEYVEMPDADRCAGGAGTYLVKDFETSQRIVERKRQAVEQSGAEVVATSCPACMIQLRTGLQGAAEVKHVAQLLQAAYEAADQTDEIMRERAQGRTHHMVTVLVFGLTLRDAVEKQSSNARYRSRRRSGNSSNRTRTAWAHCCNSY